MKRKFLWVLVVLVCTSMIVSTSLIGCKEEAPEEVVVEEAPVEEAAEEEADEIVAEKNFEGQTLTVIYMSGTYADAARLVKDEFEELTGAKVEVVDAPYASLYEKELTDLLTGTGSFDVLEVACQWDGQYSQYLEPIDGMIESDNFDFSAFLTGVSERDGMWEGIRYGIPNACDGRGIAYRTDLFEENGISDKYDEEWTFEAFENAAEKLTKDGMYGLSIAGVKGQIKAPWLNRYRSLGGVLISEDWKTPLPQRELAVQALDMIINDLKYMPEGVMSYAVPELNEAFLSGSVAMAEIWPSFIRGPANADDSIIKGKWNIMPYPNTKAILSGWNLAISKESDVKELAWEWIKFYTSEEKQLLFLEEVGIGPTRTSIYEDPVVLEKYTDFENMKIILATVRPLFRIPVAQEAMDTLSDQMSAALAGDVSSEEAIDEVIRVWSEVISSNPPDSPYTGE